MTDGPTPPPLAQLMLRQLNFEKATEESLVRLQETIAKSMTGAGLLGAAILDGLIRKGLITEAEAISAIDSAMAELFGGKSNLVEQTAADVALQTVRLLRKHRS